LPVASVKVDKSFVTPLGKGNDSVATAIVRAIVELGHSLNLDVIAEGVDSPVAQSAVTALGCDAMQGFYIAMPMEPQALQPWIASHGLRTPGARATSVPAPDQPDSPAPGAAPPSGG
jgi:EAL domain-containing protein (putative c-di-GMP-specific phosphodiesterase class I)